MPAITPALVYLADQTDAVHHVVSFFPLYTPGRDGVPTTRNRGANMWRHAARLASAVSFACVRRRQLS
jgi:hypothetical protein